MTPQELLEQAGINLVEYGNGRHYVTCPQCSAKRTRHNQKARCLGVTIRNGKVCWGCNHCGWTGPEKGAAKGNGNGAGYPVKTEYFYDAGDIDLRKVRKTAGGFFWQHRNGGTWENGTGGTSTSSLLYRIAEAKQCIEMGEPVLVVEGEKDVDTCWDLGFAATCNAHGASEPDKAAKWTTAHSAQLRGANLIVCGDNDEPGRAHVKAVCECSQNVAASVRVIDLAAEWDELPDGGDISDWAAWAGKGAESRLGDLVREAKAYEAPAGAPAQPSRRKHNMADLKGKVFDPMKWIIPRYIPEGVTILAGKPKVGKSWLMLTTSLSVAMGETVLGETCALRNVIYYALEDNERRMQERTSKLIGMSVDWPSNMTVFYELPNVDHGCVEQIEKDLSETPADLIIIDTLAAIKGQKIKTEEPYQHDYRTIKTLHDLGRKRGISIIIVHHLRKAKSDDEFDNFSGTLGLTGAADTLVVLARTKKDELRFMVRGRDVEPEDKIVEFDSDLGEWNVVGDYEEEASITSGAKDLILGHIMASAVSMKPADIVKATGLGASTVRGTLKRMLDDGKIKKTAYGTYHV